MKRVFILSSNSLFSQGVEILLGKEKGMQIVGRETDAEKAIQQIGELQPDVVLVEPGPPECERGLLVMRILEERPVTRIVGLNLTDNSIMIYHGEERVASSVRDLMKAIDNEEGEMGPAI